MTWGLWISLLGLIASASAFAVSAYFAWSFRYRIMWLGVTSEVALAAAIFFGACTGFAWLLGHTP